jgi:O-succinylbenzoic acid--CoA ligase|tara:strand:- start:2180 stop:3436 length:1257 start_codon:yes stop_codon:yes gene_type:complete
MKQDCAELKRRGVSSIVPKSKTLAFAEASDASTFLAEMRGAFEAEIDLGLLGADWPESERVHARSRLLAFANSEQAVEWRQKFGPLIYIASGGTTGERRFAVHTAASLRAAALGFIEGFGAPACAAWNVLPLYHVGGLMTLLRALEAGAPWEMGRYRKLSETAPPKEFRAALSLVPTQLHRLLEIPAAVRNLRKFQRIFIGGAELSGQDAESARAEGLSLSPCYGMTETAAMVAALEPEAFLRGVDGCGHPLPHARVVLAEEDANEEAAIGIVSSSLALGWDSGEVFDQDLFWTQDTGRFDPEGHIVVTGRLDRMINTGGEKVDPLRVENAIQRLADVDDVAVVGFSDVEWGEVVVAFVVGGRLAPEAISTELKKSVRPAEVPKVVMPLQILPRSAMGKLDRTALEKIWKKHLKPSEA